MAQQFDVPERGAEVQHGVDKFAYDAIERESAADQENIESKFDIVLLQSGRGKAGEWGSVLDREEHRHDQILGDQRARGADRTWREDCFITAKGGVKGEGGGSRGRIEASRGIVSWEEGRVRHLRIRVDKAIEPKELVAVVYEVEEASGEGNSFDILDWVGEW